MREKLTPFCQNIIRTMSAGIDTFQQSFSQSVAQLQDAQVSSLALLIDGENISAEFAVYILAEAGKFGCITIRRVYGNWALPTMQRWQEMITHYGMTPIQHQLPTVGKNAADIALTVDAIELFHNNGIKRFCLVSSDSDYTPLVRRLREYGCFVLGIGKEETLSSLKHACTVFVATDQLLPPSTRAKTILPSQNSSVPLPKTSSTPPSEKAKQAVPMSLEASQSEMSLQALLNKAYRQLATTKGDEWVTLVELGNMLKKLDPQFTVKAHGSRTLKALIQQQANSFQIQKMKGQIAIRLKGE